MRDDDNADSILTEDAAQGILDNAVELIEHSRLVFTLHMNTYKREYT